MILVDTSVWVDHLRRGDAALVRLLEERGVLCHPWIVGGIALGNLRDRHEVLTSIGRIPAAMIATDEEVVTLIDTYRLDRRGIGYVDAHLLASTRLTPGSRLWTRDQRLCAVAVELDVAFV